MTKNTIISIIQKTRQSPWLPIMSMLISLFGIEFLNWNYQYVIILFVCEIALMLSFAIIKMLFALNELPFYKLLMEKLIYLIVGVAIGILFIVFSVMFMSKSIQTDLIFSEIKLIKFQISLLTLGYCSNLFFNYFVNQNFRTAVPMNQMVPFFQVLTILAILQGFTGHLLPTFINLNHAVAGIVALVLVKFFVDLLFSYFHSPDMFTNRKSDFYNTDFLKYK